MKKFIIFGISVLLLSSVLAVSVAAQDQETGFSKFVFWLWDKIKPLITGEVVSIAEEPSATILDFSSVINLTDANVTFNGIVAGDLSGHGVGSGDFNNDGIDDVIIGAVFGGRFPGFDGAGQSYIVFGPFNSNSTIELSGANVTFNGTNALDLSGSSVGSGDFNNDGVDDVIIGAIRAAPSGPSSGKSYIFFGPFNSGSSIKLSGANVTFNGTDTGDEAGHGVGSGDFNNDGVDDVIIGAPQGDPSGKINAGESYIMFGPFNSGSSIKLSGANVTFNGIDAGDIAGFSVGSGDFNNDSIV